MRNHVTATVTCYDMGWVSLRLERSNREGRIELHNQPHRTRRTNQSITLAANYRPLSTVTFPIYMPSPLGAKGALA